jgi:pilus assembly protein CpaB
MNQNSRTFWLSIGAALFAMFLIYSYTQEQKAVYDKRFGSTKTVLIAAKDIQEISTLDETMVVQEERPTDFIQPGAAENPDDVVGLVAATPIKKGEQIVLTKLLAPGPNTGLSHQVALAKRAMTIPVDEVRGVGKLLRPGDRVDVLTSISYGDGRNERREVKTLLQDVLVLATGLNITNNIPRVLQLDNFNGKPMYKNLNGDTGYGSVTLEVAPEEAQNIVYILSVAPGAIFLTLRNGNDKVLNRIQTSTVDRVLGLDSDRNLQLQLQKAQAAAAAAAASQQQQNQNRTPASPFQEIRGSDVRY